MSILFIAIGLVALSFFKNRQRRQESHKFFSLRYSFKNYGRTDGRERGGRRK